MELRRILFNRCKLWHFYASVISLIVLTCFMLLSAPATTLRVRDKTYQHRAADFSSGVVSIDSLQFRKKTNLVNPLVFGVQGSESSAWRVSAGGNGNGDGNVNVKTEGKARGGGRRNETKGQFPPEYEDAASKGAIDVGAKDGSVSSVSSWAVIRDRQREMAALARARNPGGRPDGPYERFLDKPVINRHDFAYLINQADACRGGAEGSAVHVIITTPSAPGNFFRRMKARAALKEQEFAGVTAGIGSGVRRMFFLGATLDQSIQNKIEAESSVYGDIVQESYLDVYKNITFKAVQMLRWVSEFCPGSEYVLRLDDDVMANVVKLLGAMTRMRKRYDNFVMGTVKRGWPPCRIPKCKTTKEEYPYSTLPPFALGGALGYPTTSVVRLYEASKRVRFFKLDDVYVTGMCAPLVNVTLLEDREFSFEHHAW